MSSLKWFTINGAGNVLTYTGSWNVEGDINFTGGIYQNGTPLSIGTGGSTQWTSVFGSGIYYNGPVVGIGRTDPSTAYKLDVGGDINLTGDIYKNGVIIAGNTGNGASLWGENGGELFTLTNVGINTNNPAVPLHVNSTTSVFSTSSGIRLGTNTDYATLNYVMPTLGTEYLLIQGTKEGVANNRNISLNPAGGNVGIGLTNPIFRMDVSGDINITGDLFKGGVLYQPWLDNQVLKQTTSNIFNYYYNDGNIGIGTTDPQYALHVEGQTKIDDIFVTNTTISSGSSLTLSTPGDIYLNSNTGSKNVFNNTTIVPYNYLGIGTLSPDRPLHILSSTNPLRLQTTSGSGCFIELFTAGYNSGNIRAGYIGYANSSSSDLRIQNEASGDIILDTNFPYRIGLNKPLISYTNLSPPSGWSSVSQNDSKILFYDGGGSNWAGMGVDNGGHFWLRTGTGGQNLLTMTSGGFVGINTASPGTSHRVRVNGDVYSENTIKAYATWYWGGSSVVVINAYNVNTIQRTGTGLYKLTFYSYTFPSANYGHVSGATIGSDGYPSYVNHVTVVSSTECNVQWGTAHAAGIAPIATDPASSSKPATVAFVSSY